MVIGKAIAGHRLVTGGSGIALGLPDNLRAAGLVGAQAASAFAPRSGPAVVLSGSCSPASREQIALYAGTHPALLVAPHDLMAGRVDTGSAFAFAMANLDKAPAIYTTADPAEVAAAQKRHGREQLAARIEHFFGSLAAELARAGVVRMAIGGGETSGAVVTALGVTAFAVGPEIDPGVPALAELGERGLRLALKSGNFGALDFYDKALGRLAGG
jgi:3-dehydrotetronate 4-kinase